MLVNSLFKELVLFSFILSRGEKRIMFNALSWKGDETDQIMTEVRTCSVSLCLYYSTIFYIFIYTVSACKFGAGSEELI